MALPLEAASEPNRYCMPAVPRHCEPWLTLRGNTLLVLEVCRGTLAVPEAHTSCAPCAQPPTPGWT